MGNSPAALVASVVDAAATGGDPRLLQAGDRAQYYSVTHAEWVDCTVVEVGPTGDVEVSCKRGSWIPASELASRLRAAPRATASGAASGGSPTKGALSSWALCDTPEGDDELIPMERAFDSFAKPPPSLRCGQGPPVPHFGFGVGDRVEYRSETHNRWIPCSVDKVGPAGQVLLDCRPGRWFSLEEQASKLRLVASRDEASPGGEAAEGQDMEPIDPEAQGSVFGSVPFLGLMASSPPSASSLGRDSLAGSMASGQVSTMSSMVAEARSMGSFASLASFASFGSMPPSSSQASPIAGGVAFDPGVEVVAFKEGSSPSKLKSRGRTYECNLGSAVQVPATWSFASASSFASTTTGPTGSVGPPLLAGRGGASFGTASRAVRAGGGRGSSGPGLAAIREGGGPTESPFQTLVAADPRWGY